MSAAIKVIRGKTSVALDPRSRPKREFDAHLRLLEIPLDQAVDDGDEALLRYFHEQLSEQVKFINRKLLQIASLAV